MIRIGPAGIPLSCKGRTVKDGVIYTRNLELDAMQVQFVRGIRMEHDEAIEVGRVAREAMVELHVHAPYYTNLALDPINVEKAMSKIVSAGMLAEAMGAKTLAIHCGLYSPDGPERTKELVIERIRDILEAFKTENVGVKLALEVAGKQALFGSLEEIIEVCQAVPGVIPILDFAHIHARSNGGLLAQEDFQEVFDKAAVLGLNHYLIHFAGILYENGNERHHLPIKKGDLRFELMVECILDKEYDVTIVSHSPILEHDAMYMKIVLDRVREKREQKELRAQAAAEAEREKERQRIAREKEAEAKRKAKETEVRKKEREEARKKKERERVAALKVKEREKAKKAAARKKAVPKKAAPKKKAPTAKKVAKPKKAASKSKKPAKKKAPKAKKAAGKKRR